MTVGTTASIKKFTVTGSESQFDFNFVALNTNNLNVTFYTPDNVSVLLVENTHYTATLGSVGGTIYKTGSFPSGTGVLVVKRVTPLTQDTAFIENQKRPSKVTEDAFDKSVLIDQEIKSAHASFLKIAENRNINTLINPLPNHVIGLNAAGDGFVNFLPSANFLQISSVTTLAQLRTAEPTSDGQVIAVIGHSIAGFGGGIFRYDATDTTTNDNNGTVIVTVGGKRWKRFLSNNSLYVEDFGAVGDGFTDCTTAIQNTIDAVFALGGGAVKFKGGTYIASRIVLRRVIILWSEAFNKVDLKQKANSNQDFIISENFHAITNSGLRVKDSVLVPYWCGVVNIRIDGNKQNQSAGNWRGLCIYAAAPIGCGTIMVHNCKGDGIYTEYANSAGSDDWTGQEEAQFRADVFVRDNDGKGWLFRGPHNSRLGYVVPKSNGDWGFVNETAENYDGLIDWMDCLHPYQNGINTSRKGALFKGSCTIGKLIGDGGGTEVDLLPNVGQRVRINEVNMANVGVARSGFKITSGQVVVDKMIGNPQDASPAATFPVLEILTDKNTINSFFSVGNSAPNLTAIKDMGSFNKVSNIQIEGYTGANSVGLDLNTSKSFAEYQGTIVNCKKAVNYAGGTQNRLNLAINVTSGQEIITGSRPSGSSDFNIFATGANVKGTKVIAKTISGNRVSLTTTDLQTITVPHTFLYTPLSENVTFTWSQITNVNDYAVDIAPTFVSADDTNITFKLKLRTASATSGAVADILIRIELP